MFPKQEMSLPGDIFLRITMENCAEWLLHLAETTVD
jgi:hypothetical protein